MNLEVVAKKLSGMAEKIQAEKGPLELFGLFLRENSLNLWDVVIAADWLNPDERASFEYVANHLQETLTEDERVGLSRIVILQSGDAVVTAFVESFGHRTGLADVHFVTEGGAIIRRVYILVNRDTASAAQQRKPKKSRPSKANS